MDRLIFSKKNNPILFLIINNSVPFCSQNIELQIWYPTEILASGEGDKGYRYRLELSEEGMNDQMDTRISARDSSKLVVQQLGGRNNAAVLPIHD